MRSKPSARRRFLSILGVSVGLHVVLFGARRESKRVVADYSPPSALELISVSDLEPAPEPQTQPPEQSPGPTGRSAPDDQVATGAAGHPQPLQAVFLSDLRAGMQSLTGLKPAALTMDDSDIALASAQAADTILAAPYPFPRVGGTRIGLVGGGGNCPAVPFP